MHNTDQGKKRQNQACTYTTPKLAQIHHSEVKNMLAQIHHPVTTTDFHRAKIRRYVYPMNKANTFDSAVVSHKFVTLNQALEVQGSVWDLVAHAINLYPIAKDLHNSKRIPALGCLDQGRLSDKMHVAYASIPTW
jgi:hypothetical protein